MIEEVYKPALINNITNEVRKKLEKYTMLRFGQLYCNAVLTGELRWPSLYYQEKKSEAIQMITDYLWTIEDTSELERQLNALKQYNP